MITFLGICLVIDTDAGPDSSTTDDGSRIHVRRPNFTKHNDEDSKSIPQSSNSIWLVNFIIIYWNCSFIVCIVYQLAIRRQISFIDNQKLKMKTSPKEEQLPQGKHFSIILEIVH